MGIVFIAILLGFIGILLLNLKTFFLLINVRLPLKYIFLIGGIFLGLVILAMALYHKFYLLGVNIFYLVTMLLVGAVLLFSTFTLLYRISKLFTQTHNN